MPPILADLYEARNFIYFVLSTEESDLQDLTDSDLFCIAEVLALKFLQEEILNSSDPKIVQTCQRLIQSDKYRDANTQDRIRQSLLESGSRRGIDWGKQDTDNSVQTRDELPKVNFSTQDMIR